MPGNALFVGAGAGRVVTHRGVTRTGGRAPGGLAASPGLAATRGLRRGRSRAGLGFELLPQFTFYISKMEQPFLVPPQTTLSLLLAQSPVASVSPPTKGGRRGYLQASLRVPSIKSESKASTPQQPSPLLQGGAGCRCPPWLYQATQGCPSNVGTPGSGCGS